MYGSICVIFASICLLGGKGETSIIVGGFLYCTGMICWQIQAATKSIAKETLRRDRDFVNWLVKNYRVDVRHWLDKYMAGDKRDG